MSATEAYFYCDETTRGVLAEGGEKVLLLGSYGGFSNFGDVLQLKGAIAWHRATTRFEPVLICHATAIPDSGFCQRQRSWFGVQAILYWSPERLDLSPAGLSELTDATSLPRLHVYGGGFLNRYWGSGAVASIEGVIRGFGVGQYVLSGQQIDEQFVPELREHFRRHKPTLAGGRDALSTRLLGAGGVDAADSFDDAAEPLLELVSDHSAAGNWSADLLVHLNLSYYTGAERIDEIVEVLARFGESARKHAGGREPKVVLLQAYRDKRLGEIIDAMGAVSYLEDRFPFLRFELLELGQLSLQAGRPGFPTIGLPRGRLGLSSSYHVFMLMSLLGVPCYLLAANSYYEQKRAGLGGGVGVDEFLAAPGVQDLSSRFALREPWLTRLAQVFRTAPSSNAPTIGPSQDAAATQRWQPKGLARQAEIAPANSEEIESLRAGFDERGRRVQELEAHSQQLWDDLQRITRNFEAEIRRLNNTHQQLAQAFEARGQRVEELEQHARSLWEEMQTSAANFEAEIEKLLRASAALAEGFEERGRRVQELEAHANELWAEIQRLAGAGDPRGSGVR